jgi:hypothetical protein
MAGMMPMHVCQAGAQGGRRRDERMQISDVLPHATSQHHVYGSCRHSYLAQPMWQQSATEQHQIHTEQRWGLIVTLVRRNKWATCLDIHNTVARQT